MEVSARVIVHEDDFNRPGEILYDETTFVHALDGVSLDALNAAALEFAQEMGLTDWFAIRVQSTVRIAGGDAESVVVIFEFLQNLRTVAWTGLAAAFSAFLVKKINDRDN